MPEPDPDPGALLVRGLALGVCGTDKEIDGYGSELWRVEPEYAVVLDTGLERVGMLMEPTTVVAKADLTWPDRLVTRRIPLTKATDTFTAGDGDVEVVITLSE